MLKAKNVQTIPGVTLQIVLANARLGIMKRHKTLVLKVGCFFFQLKL